MAVDPAGLTGCYGFGPGFAFGFGFFTKTAVAPAFAVIGSVQCGRVPWHEPAQRVKRQPASGTALSATGWYDVSGSRHRL